MTRKSRIVTLTWTEQIIADDVAPDTDSIIYLAGCEFYSVEFDTNGATTGVPTFDLHTIASNSGTFPTSHYQDNIFTAQAKDVVAFSALTRAPRYVKFRLDVNTANLAATEYVQAVVYIDADNAGRVVDAGMD